MNNIKICLDAGHAGKENRSPVVPEFYESDFNWKLHLKLKAELEAYGIQVITTRASQEEVLGTKSRGKLAQGCDLFLSIHSNAADRESADYPLAIVPVNGSGDGIGKKLADCVRNVMDTDEPADMWTKKSDSGADWYGVINGAAQVGVPGIILEHSFYTNAEKARWMLEDANLDKLAKAEAEVIATHYGVEKPEQKATYRVISGAYTVRGNADNKLVAVRAIYPDAIMIQAGGYYKIQIAQYNDLDAAKAKMAEVKGKGLDAYISTDAEVTVVAGSAPAPAPAEPAVSLDEIARAVINGDYGNGHATREANLKAAGMLEHYTYAQIRARVNELCK